jgi:hypothetical protein
MAHEGMKSADETILEILTGNNICKLKKMKCRAGAAFNVSYMLRLLNAVSGSEDSAVCRYFMPDVSLNGNLT